MEKKNRKFSLGQRVLFEGKEYEICFIDLICNDDSKIYALAELDAAYLGNQSWNITVKDGTMLTNGKCISIWVPEILITLVDNPKETLLEEARRRYPKGTVYIPAHIPGSDAKCTVSNPDDFFMHDSDILESDGNKEKNGHVYNECIYYKGKWAKIVEAGKELPLEEKYVDSPVDPNVFPAGSYVVLLATCDINVKWVAIPVNYCYKLHDDSDSNHFLIDKDLKGSITNGWYAQDYESKLKLRAATPEEIAEYQRLDKPFDVTKVEETFQIGKWYRAKNTKSLFIKPTAEKEGNVIWSSGVYQDDYSENINNGSIIKEYELLEDLSIIQEFLPDEHPDKILGEEPKSLVGRYLKVLDASAKKHYGIKNGDYLLFDRIGNDNEYQHWGELGVKHYHGINVHENPDFKLMPEGFHPLDELITTTELKTGEWYKYKIYSSEKWKYILIDYVTQVDTCKEVYFTQKIVDGKLVHESGSLIGTALEERLIEVAASEIHLIISHNQYPLTPKEAHPSRLNEQYKIQHQYNVLMDERETLIKQEENKKFPTLKRKRKQKLVNTIVNIPTVVERIKRNK